MRANNSKTSGYYINEEAQWKIVAALEALDNLCDMMAETENPAYAVLALIKDEFRRGADGFELAGGRVVPPVIPKTPD